MTFNRLTATALVALSLGLTACSSSREQTAAASIDPNAAGAGAGAGGAGTGLPGGANAGYGQGALTPAQEIQQVGDRVRFSLDSSDLTSEARATLDQQAAVLQRYPAIQVLIEGHADERGTRDYNIALGQRRADAVAAYLAQVGVQRGRIQTTSYGKERPEVDGNDSGAWSINRRAVTAIQ